MVAGDFHILVLASGCNCIDPIHDDCRGQFLCNGGCDLYSWGFNVYGQCDGIPSEKSVLTPKIVPFFSSNGIKIDKIAARRSRSLAVAYKSNDVYEWGSVESEQP